MPNTDNHLASAGSPPLRLGFIGGGINSAVGRTHFSALRIDGLFDLRAGCFSRHDSINRQSAEFYGVAPERTYSSLKALLENEQGKLDALVILTPTSDHYPLLLACLEKGARVICEKAMVATLPEALAVREAERRHRGFLAVTYNYTAYPALRELRALVDSGRLGRLRHLVAEMPQEGFLRCDAGGRPLQPQHWRLHDGPIPTVYLDLGVHLHQIVNYLTRLRPLSVSAFHSSYGHFAEVVDYVSASVEYPDGVHGNYTFGKSMLGDRNGLRIRLYGDAASAEWIQTEPEELHLFHKNGSREILDRGGDVSVANQPRYTRFKVGHPAGYVEAFANLYGDIHHSLMDYAATGHWHSDEVFGADLACEGLSFLQAMADSAREGKRLAVPVN